MHNPNLCTIGLLGYFMLVGFVEELRGAVNPNISRIERTREVIILLKICKSSKGEKNLATVPNSKLRKKKRRQFFYKKLDFAELSFNVRALFKFRGG